MALHNHDRNASSTIAFPDNSIIHRSFHWDRNIMRLQDLSVYVPWLLGAVAALVTFGNGRTKIETVPCLVAARDFGRESLQVDLYCATALDEATASAGPDEAIGGDADDGRKSMPHPLVSHPSAGKAPGNRRSTAERTEPVRGFKVVHLQIPNADMRRAVVRADRSAQLIGTKLNRHLKKGEVLLHNHVELRPPSQGPSYEVFPVMLDESSNAKSLAVEELRIGRSVEFVRDVNKSQGNPKYKILDFERRSDNGVHQVLLNLMLEIQSDGALSIDDRKFVDAVRRTPNDAFTDAHLD